MDRRRFISSLASPLVVSALPSSALAESNPREFNELVEQFRAQGNVPGLDFATLRKRRGLNIGATVPYTSHKRIPDGMWKVLSKEFNTLTPEIHLEWEMEWQWPNDQKYMRKYTNSGKRVRGHNLYFYQRLPDPIISMARDKSITPGKLGDYIYSKVSSRVKRWGNRVAYWSINETMSPKGSAGIRSDPVTDKLGQDLIRILFAAVKDHSPNKPIEMNDWVVEHFGSSRDKYISKTADYLDKYGFHIDRIGYQCHMNRSKGGKAISRNVMKSVSRLQSLGTQFAITEIDVDDRAFRGDTLAREEYVAREMYVALKQMRNIPRLAEVATWSPFDQDNWIRRNDSKNGNFSVKAADVSRCGLFDEQYRRKLSYYAVCRALM